MNSDEFPLILSPNLGCPLIVEVDEDLAGSPDLELTLIVAGRYGEFDSPVKELAGGRLFLRPSDPGATGLPNKVDLATGDPIEIKDWNLLADFKKPDETRHLINNILHYDILGEGTRYWRIRVQVKTTDQASGAPIKSLLRKHSNSEPCLPTLYDLVVQRSSEVERVNYHAVQFVDSNKERVDFIHVTDLHISKRNDEILGEVLEDKQERRRETIEQEYINFNRNVRLFIECANKLADEGKLDFVVITGDLVDYAFHGWEYDPNPSENNWRSFIHIFTGMGSEKALRNNEGIKVAIFTSTGNHDWRSYPYALTLKEYAREFGLTKKEAGSFCSRGFDLDEFLKYEKKQQKSPHMVRNTFRLPSMLDMARILGKIKLFFSPYLAAAIVFIVLALLFFIGITGLIFIGSIVAYFTSQAPQDSQGFVSAVGDSVRSAVGDWGTALALITAALSAITTLVKKTRSYGQRLWSVLVIAFMKWLRPVVSMYLQALYAGPMSLHYYLKHVNPYLDYAFRYRDDLFVVMDTGMDYAVGEVTEKAQSEERQGLGFSIQDNIQGGAPDSYGFDYRKLYCDWSQIVWLERTLEIGQTLDGSKEEASHQHTRRRFIFVHAPPLNPDMANIADKIDWYQFTESGKAKKHDFNPWDRFKAPQKTGTKGAPISFRKQFIDAKKEYDSKQMWIAKSERGLTYGTLNNYRSHFFFLCMGYRENEVRGKGDPKRRNEVDLVFSGHAHRNIEFRVDKDREHNIRVYSDQYSWIAQEIVRRDEWLDVFRPVILQTAAGGLAGSHDPVPPYFRRVTIDKEGCVADFRVCRVKPLSAQATTVPPQELLGCGS